VCNREREGKERGQTDRKGQMERDMQSQQETGTAAQAEVSGIGEGPLVRGRMALRHLCAQRPLVDKVSSCGCGRGLRGYLGARGRGLTRFPSAKGGAWSPRGRRCARAPCWPLAATPAAASPEMSRYSSRVFFLELFGSTGI
jgi:hypothetical protein